MNCLPIPAIVAFSILGALLLLCFYKLWRNERVYALVTKIHYLVFETGGDWERKLRVQKRVTYDEMMSSFKPVKMESFYTAEEIAILKSTTP